MNLRMKFQIFTGNCSLNKIAILIFDCLIRMVPSLTKRYAGRRITIEKIIAEITNKYFEDNETIFVPVFVSLIFNMIFFYLKHFLSIQCTYTISLVI